MERVGFIFLTSDSSYVLEQISMLKKYGIKKIATNEEEISSLKNGDEVIIYELRSLGKSVTQLNSFFKYLRQKKIKIILLSKRYDYLNLSNEQLFKVVEELSKMESFIISERTTKGIRKARNSGRVGGRPKISDKKIKKIKYLYLTQSYTLRRIDEECNVSLGTVCKYIHNYYYIFLKNAILIIY